MPKPSRSMPPKLHVHLNANLRLGISALRNRGRELPGGLHIALEEWVGDGYDRRASFIVPRGAQLEKFFTALEQAEAEAVACGWWPREQEAA